MPPTHAALVFLLPKSPATLKGVTGVIAQVLPDSPVAPSVALPGVAQVALGASLQKHMAEQKFIFPKLVFLVG